MIPKELIDSVRAMSFEERKEILALLTEHYIAEDKSSCLHCGDPIHDSKREFCDSECRDSYEACL